VKVRISVTAIDSWLWYQGDDDMEFSALLAQLRGETPPNEAMRKGSAFHKALETASIGEFSYLEADGYRFLIEPNVELALPQIRELKLEGEYRVGGLTVELVGKVDAVEGNTVYDHKTTGRFDADRLLNTFQWRYYLDLARADAFVWNVFEVGDTYSEAPPEWYPAPTRVPGIEAIKQYNVTAFHAVSQYRYPGLEADCQDKLQEFVDALGLTRMQFPSGYCTLADLLRANRPAIGVGQS